MKKEEREITLKAVNEEERERERTRLFAGKRGGNRRSKGGCEKEGGGVREEKVVAEGEAEDCEVRGVEVASCLLSRRN